MPGNEQQQQGQQQQQPPAGDQQQQQQAAGDQQQQQQQAATTPATFDEWLNAQPPEIKALYETHTAGLKNALQSERTQRGDLAKQIKDLASKAEAGSAAQKTLQEMSGKLEDESRRADFYEEAVKPEIGCKNPRLAYITAREDDLIDAKGRVNWTQLKTNYPELFRDRVPAVSAGAGTNNPPAAKGDMNSFIRTAAGRG